MSKEEEELKLKLRDGRKVRNKFHRKREGVVFIMSEKIAKLVKIVCGIIN